MPRRQLLRASILVFTGARVEDVAEQGKAFKWERPSCPVGCPKVWGHGYVARIFVGILLAVLLKRYRCRTCRKVFTMVPDGFSARHQTAAAAMVAALAARLRHRGWPIGTPRQRAGHWLRKFLAKCRMNHPLDDPLTILGTVAGGRLFV